VVAGNFYNVQISNLQNGDLLSTLDLSVPNGIAHGDVSEKFIPLFFVQRTFVQGADIKLTIFSSG